MPMITAPVLNAVQQLLQERGIEKRNDERLGDYVARGLNITRAQADTLLEALHDGKTLEQAQAEAGIVPGDSPGLLAEIAKVIGAALGRVAGATGSTPKL
jgi:hypothetical protein